MKGEFLPDSSRIFCRSGLEWLLVLFSLQTGMTFERQVQSAEPPVTALAASADGRWIAAGSQRGIRLLSSRTLETVARWAPPFRQVHDVVFEVGSDDSGWRLIISGGTPSEEGGVVMLRGPSLAVEQAWSFGEDVSYAVAMIGQRDGTRKLWAASVDQHVYVLSDAAKPPRRLPAAHSRGVLAVASLSEEFMVVTAGLDNSLRVWNSDGARVIRSFNNHVGPVFDLAVRPGSSVRPMLASCSKDGTVRLWQPTIGRMVRFARLKAVPRCLAWSGDGKVLFAGCSDGAIRAMDPETTEILGTFPLFDRPILSLLVSQPGHAAVAGGFDGNIQKWPVDFFVGEASPR